MSSHRQALALLTLPCILASRSLPAQNPSTLREFGRRPVAGVDLARGTATPALARLERGRAIQRYVVGRSATDSTARTWLRVLGIRDGELEAADFWLSGPGLDSRVLAVVGFPRPGALGPEGWQTQTTRLGVTLSRLHGVSPQYGDLYATEVPNLLVALDGDLADLVLRAVVWVNDPRIWQNVSFETVEELAQHRAVASASHDSLSALPTAGLNTFATQQRSRALADYRRVIDGVAANLARDVTDAGPANAAPELSSLMSTGSLADYLRQPAGARQWRALWDQAKQQALQSPDAGPMADSVMWALVRLRHGTEGLPKPPITDADVEQVVLEWVRTVSPARRTSLVREVLQYMANRLGKGNTALGWSFVPAFVAALASAEFAGPDVVAALESILRVRTHPPPGMTPATLVPDTLLARVYERLWAVATPPQRPRMWALAFDLHADAHEQGAIVLPAAQLRRMTEELIGPAVDADLAALFLNRVVGQCFMMPPPAFVAALDSAFLQGLHRRLWDRSSTHDRTRLLRGATEMKSHLAQRTGCPNVFPDAYLATLSQDFGRAFARDLAAGESRLNEILSYLDGQDGAAMPQSQADQLVGSIWEQLSFDQRLELFRSLEGNRVSPAVRDRARRDMADTLLARSRAAEADGRLATAAALAELAGDAGGAAYRDSRRVRSLLIRLAPEFWTAVEVRGEGAAGRRVFRRSWQTRVAVLLAPEDWTVIADSVRARGRDPIAVTLAGPIELALRAAEHTETISIDVKQQVDAYTPAFLEWARKVDETRASIARLQRSVGVASALGQGTDRVRTVTAQSTTTSRDSAGNLGVWETRWQMDLSDHRRAYARAFAAMYQNDLDAALARLERLEMERPTPTAKVTRDAQASYTQNWRTWTAAAQQRVRLERPGAPPRDVAVSAEWQDRQLKITNVPAGAVVTAVDRWRDEPVVRPLAMQGVTADLDRAIQEHLEAFLAEWAGTRVRGYAIGLIKPTTRFALLAEEELWAAYFFAHGEPPLRLHRRIPDPPPAGSESTRRENLLDQLRVLPGVWINRLHHRAPCCEPEQFIVPAPSPAATAPLVQRTPSPPYEIVSRYRQVARLEGTLGKQLPWATSDLQPWDDRSRLLLSTAKDVVVYDVPSGKQVLALGARGLAPSFVFGGKEIALVLPDPLDPENAGRALVIHDARNGKRTREIAARASSGEIRDYWTLPNGAWAVTMVDLQRLMIVSSADTIPIGTLGQTSISPDLSRVANIGIRNELNVTVARPQAGRAARAALSIEAHGKSVRSMRFDRSGTRLLTASADGTAKLFDGVTGGTLQTFVHGDELADARFLAGETRVLTVASNGADVTPGSPVKLWDAVTGRLVAEWRQGSSDGPSLRITASEHLWFGYESGRIAMVEAAMGTFIGAVAVANVRGFDRVAASPDGRYVAASAGDFTWVWELEIE